MLDLRIVGGHVVLPGVGVERADLGISGGRIAAIGRSAALPEARETLDATGLHILPGLVDPHVHFGSVRPFEQDIASETVSGLHGGVTTVGWYLAGPTHYATPFEGSYFDHFASTIEVAQRYAAVDFFVHFRLDERLHLDELPRYARELGVTSFKLYMAGLYGRIPTLYEDYLYAAFKALKALGSPCLPCVHAENKSFIDEASARIRAERPEATLADWAETHPALGEEEAIARAGFLAEKAESPLYVAHVSSAQGVARVRKLKASGVPIYAETTTPYLSVTYDDPIGVLGKMVPPIRGPQDRDGLWQGIADGTIDCIGNDETSKTRSSKMIDLGMWDALGGYPTLETSLAVLLSEGYHKRRVSLARIVEISSTNPAKLFGLYPRKGAIAVGADADLAVCDLSLERRADHRDLHSHADFSLQDGRVLTGWPIGTIKSGKVAIWKGELRTKAGSGRFLPRRLG